MASLYGKMGQYDHAIFNANSSIKVFEKHKLIDWIAHAYEIKGNLYLYQDKLEWALYWFDQSELIHEHLEDDRQRIDLFHGIAEAHLGLKKDSIAELYTHKALELSKTINSATGKRKSAEILYKINKHRANHEIALGYHETYHSLSDSIINNAGENSLLLLKTKTTYEEQKAALIVSNAEALANQKNYITGFLGILLALILIIFLVKRSEKIQKNLNAKLKNKQAALEKHEAELMEINQTKDKLFSIIGHDLRAPIGAFQGLIQMFRKGEVNQKEFLSFIPKLGSDIDHISFTLNNLLSWGHSQMNGSTTRPENTSLTGIIEENMNLLAEIANSKSIKIINEVPEDFMTWSDSNQITIVLRNLISNSLKFTPENGMVTLRAKELKDYYEIAVIDTGVGMDKETRAKIFSKNDNVTTYGTNNEKGTGLGLMLCKEMVEKNNGEIWVDSAPKIGTTFYFTLPKAKKVAIQRAG
jgi:signal transduction histidine kinase